MPATVPKFVRLTALALVCLPLTGCGGDPAAQAEAEMQPGAYEVSLAGAPLGFAVAAQELPKRCVSGAASNIPTALVRPYMKFNEYCGSATFKRTGNLLTGSASCPLDPKMATGNIDLKFTGTINADGVEGDITGKLNGKIDDPEAEMGIKMLTNISARFSAKRTGDCTGSDSVRPSAQRSRTTASGFGSDAIARPERSEQAADTE